MIKYTDEFCPDEVIGEFRFINTNDIYNSNSLLLHSTPYPVVYIIRKRQTNAFLPVLYYYYIIYNLFFFLIFFFFSFVFSSYSCDSLHCSDGQPLAEEHQSGRQRVVVGYLSNLRKNSEVQCCWAKMLLPQEEVEQLLGFPKHF